jgi:hypothetical protein
MADFRPDLANRNQIWRAGSGQDPAKYLIPDSQLRYARPRLTSGTKEFVWPVGTEAFRHSGQAVLGVRRYIGDNAADVHVIHKDEAHIELTGTFPGLKSTDSMIALKDVITSQTPERGKILTLPGIFEEVKYVAVENYEFNHDQDDRTHSIDYSISFIVMGTGYDVKTKKPVTPAPQPGVTKKPVAGTQPGAKRPASAPDRTYTMTQNTNTLPAMAKVVYGNPDKWPQIVEANQVIFQTILASTPMYLLPTSVWGIGTKLKY